MPRILSRHTGIYRRGPSLVKATCAAYCDQSTVASTGSGATAEPAGFASYFTFLNGGLSSGDSSAPSSRRSLNHAHDSESSRCSSTSSSSRLSLSPDVTRAGGSAADDEDGNVWGHHVDPAEAEAEIIRHSRILSQRAAA